FTLRSALGSARGLEELTSLERCPVVEAMAALVEHRVVF
ncbi:MAG: hypothetical protein QOF58_6466, partial [Pseudonocardiales bacterium]|nr:hypothetical protein [Pseudonocardiales bacterium]